MALFDGKYRIESARLSGFDYTSEGCYFVTVCTRAKECFFGEVVRGEVRLSPMGEIIAEEWDKTAQVRPDVILDQCIIMPSHVHGVIALTKELGPRTVETPQRGVSTGSRPQIVRPSRLPSHSLGAIIGQFKSACTKRIWAAAYRDFAWQPRFHDHIIRSDRSLNAIRQYILNNPMNWEFDEYNPNGPRSGGR
jgi:REP element-mobilizing transposase RayT